MALLFLGNVQVRQKLWSDAEGLFKKAIELEQGLVTGNPTNGDYQRRLGRAWSGSGDVNRALTHHDQAVADYLTAIDHLKIARQAALQNEAVLLEWIDAGDGQIRSLVFLGRIDEAVNAARQLREQAERSPEGLYKLGCLLAWQSTHLARDRQAELASDAMETLRQAVAAGYRDVSKIKSEPDLDPLRERPEFQLLLMDAAFPSDALAR